MKTKGEVKKKCLAMASSNGLLKEEKTETSVAALASTSPPRSGAEKGKRTDGRTPFYVIIHNVAKKTNIGAMIRSASAFDCM